VSKTYFYKDIVIRGEKILNSNDDKWVYLTPPEKEILILLFQEKKIEKKLLLENVLKFKKDTESKTLESHLTRIRKKLLNIDSQVEIITKENIIFLVA
jgi:DNA-binding response OmpR family regulator